MDNQELLKIALEASALAESEILKIYTSDYSVEWKPDSTPVTIADKKAEEIIRNFFAKETHNSPFKKGSRTNCNT